MGEVRAMRTRMLAAAREAGRDPGAITCAFHMPARAGDRAKAGPSLVAGSPAAVTEQLLEFTRIGFTAFNFTLTGPGIPEQAQLLATQVIPAVRAAAE